MDDTKKLTFEDVNKVTNVTGYLNKMVKIIIKIQRISLCVSRINGKKSISELSIEL